MPDYKILANSRNITGTIVERFVSMVITDETGTDSDQFDLVLADHEPGNPIAMPPAGAELEIYLGYDGAVQKMGRFVVGEIEVSGWPGALVVRGTAAPYTETPAGKTDLQSQKSRSWPNGTKLQDMVAKIAKEHGLTAAVSSSLQSLTLGHLDQTEESDISFLIRIAKRYDAIAKPADGKLIVAKRGEMKTVGGEDLPQITIDAREVSRWRMQRTERESSGTVIAYWHGKRTAKKNEVTVGSGEPVRRLRHWYPTEEEAKHAAQAELDRRERGGHKLSLSTVGNPAICAESPLLLTGFRPGVSGDDWLITRAVHSLSKRDGYVCDVEAEKQQQSEAE